MTVNILRALVVALGLSACTSEQPVSLGTRPVPDTGTVPDAAGGDAPAPPPPCVDPDGDLYGPNCPLGNTDCNQDDKLSFPGAVERCGDLADNDCDGEVDEGCGCAQGTAEACWDGEPSARGVGICRDGQRFCDRGVFTTCDGQVFPLDEEVCNGVDDDCDGEVDEGLLNACGTCGDAPTERCGNLLDDDCDGAIDEDCDCDDRENQPCYGGPPQTLGFGICRGGTTSCVRASDGTSRWGACEGEVLPGVETCDGIDNDCDGVVDEGLRNGCGACGEAPAEVCDGEDNDCDGQIDEGLRLGCGLCPGEAGAEICGDGLDNDCDGRVDEECPCDGEPSCYPGPANLLGVGQCRAGGRRCDASGEFWGECFGYVLPTPEVCDDVDNDCDGQVDVDARGCSVCGSAPEICDGIDNDCDGQIDEGLRNGCGDCLEGIQPEEGNASLCDGQDNDCDGLVDEGLLNACGKCGDSCYTLAWDDPGDWGAGEAEGLQPDFAGGLQLGEAQFRFPDLWVANAEENTVTRIDTDTAQVVATYPVGHSPSRTAVDFNGDVWVGNRGFGQAGSVTKIRADCACPAQGTCGDCVAFTTVLPEPGAVGSVVRGLAIDADGYAWAGTFFTRDQTGFGRLYRLHPDDGRIVEVYGDEPGELPDVRIYGLAIDSRNKIWIATRDTPIGLACFDATTRTACGSWSFSGCTSSYGVAVDGDGNVFLGNWSCQNLVRLDRQSFDQGNATVTSFTKPAVFSLTRGVAVDGRGFVWMADSGRNLLAKFDPRAIDPQTGTLGSFVATYSTCSGPIGVGIARDNRVWVICQGSNNAQRFDADTGAVLDTVPTGRGPYSYSDMTGFQLRNFTSPRGSWRGTFDCGANRTECQFDTLSWTATTPPNTSVALRVRTSVDGQSWSAWVGPFATSPTTLDATLPRGRYCQVEVALQTAENGATPTVSGVNVQWQRP